MHYRPARWTCTSVVTLSTPAGAVSAEVHSVSSTGLGLHGIDCVSPGDLVVVKSGEVEITGRIAWAGDTRAGLEFDTPQTRKSLAAAGLRHD